VNLGVVDGVWHIAGGGDYDSDGNDDILWENTSDGSRAVWLMNGATVSKSVLLGTLSLNWHMIAASDLNSDSRADILLEDANTGNRVLWTMNRGAVQNAILLGTLPVEWKIAAATDFDGDARTDILFENTATGARAIWIEDGFGRVISAPLLTTLDPVWHMATALVPRRGGFPAGFTLKTVPFIGAGLSSPVFLAQPLNDGRIFVVEQGGKIRVVRDGVLQSTPFLDLTGTVLAGGERGLLSVAFHPQYASNHFFYVYFTGSSGEIRVERFTATADPEVADLTSRKLIFTTPHPVNDNHNGGLVSFGPDGMLYAGFGDGGGGGDPLGNGQNLNVYLGGMIRLDVDHGDPYAVPADNPFVGQSGKKPELWAKGLRNPWRYAFDPPTGTLFIADVGQDAREEIDAAPAQLGGVNYGWNIMEGFSCYNATTCNQTGLRLPILDYTHGSGCSITGGYVYRGAAIPEIRGHYFYSDYCSAFLRSVRYQNGVATDGKDWGITTLGQVKSFGQDFAGELYVIAASTVYKLARGP
jgi:glucose/arabinose dehydrogenase